MTVLLWLFGIYLDEYVFADHRENVLFFPCFSDSFKLSNSNSMLIHELVHFDVRATFYAARKVLFLVLYLNV